MPRAGQHDLQQAEIPHGGLQLILHRSRRLDQRQAASTGLPAQAVHRPLCGDRVNVGKQGLAQGQDFQLHLQAFLRFTGEPLGADVVSILGCHVGQHTDDALAAQSQQRDDLVVVAGVDVQLRTAGGSDLSYLADVAAGFLDTYDEKSGKTE